MASIMALSLEQIINDSSGHILQTSESCFGGFVNYLKLAVTFALSFRIGINNSSFVSRVLHTSDCLGEKTFEYIPLELLGTHIQYLLLCVDSDVLGDTGMVLACHRLLPGFSLCVCMSFQHDLVVLLVLS